MYLDIHDYFRMYWLPTFDGSKDHSHSFLVLPPIYIFSFLMLILIIYKFKFNSVWRRYS